MRTRGSSSGRALKLSLLLAGLAGVVAILSSLRPAAADHLCPATGSPFGPFNIETYEALDYRNTYARTMELASYNALFPEQPSFALPGLESGGRSAGSGQIVNPYIPPVLLKAIAWLESGWAQASYDPLVQYGEVGPVLASHDCGYGIMQVTSGMQNVSGVPNLEQAMIGGHYAFNVARGARILAEKWNAGPDYRPLVGARNPYLIEDWYYALWGYNGFAFKNHPLNPDYSSARVPFSCGPDGDGYGHDRSQYPYQELVMGCAARPALRAGSQLWSPQEVHLPNLSDPQFAGPLSLANWDPCVYELSCAPMDMPTPNTNHQDPTALTVERSQVIGTPAFGFSQGQFGFAAAPGQQVSAQLTVSNSGSGLLAWKAVSSAPWLWISRAQDVALAPDLGERPSLLTLNVNTTSLPPGDSVATITFESLYASGAPATVQVTVSISGTPAPTLPAGARIWGDADCGGTPTIGDSQKTARALIGLAVSQEPGCPGIGAPVTVDGVPRVWGDVDCGGGASIGDAQKLARALIGLPPVQAEGCPAVGQVVALAV